MFSKIIPALADLTQDIAGPVPVEFLQDWASGRQDIQSAERLLGRFRLRGCVVSTDSAGLTRMTGEADLLDVLRTVAVPKQIIHALGTEIGGRPLGLWVADNTRMFYPPETAIETLLDAMNEARFRIAAGRLQIGMCIHTGMFYEIGGGLYGSDGRLVEDLAEIFAGPGEILVTREVRAKAGACAEYAFIPRADLKRGGTGRVFELRSARRLAGLRGENTDYPHPYNREFREFVAAAPRSETSESLRNAIYAKYLCERTIVFAVLAPDEERGNSLIALLDDLVRIALMDAILMRIEPHRQHIASAGGGVVVLAFESEQEALAFAVLLRGELARNGLAVKIGIDSGQVLCFRSMGAPAGIAGGPVNVASKISEDLGTPGRIFLTSRTQSRLRSLPEGDHFEATISGVTLTGFSFEPG